MSRSRQTRFPISAWSLFIPPSGGADASAISPLRHPLSSASFFMDNHGSEQARNPDQVDEDVVAEQVTAQHLLIKATSLSRMFVGSVVD